MMRVRAFGGLSNRLRVILSWRHTFGSLEVVWRPDGEIAHGRFADVFEPIDGVTFLDDGWCGTKTLDPYPHAKDGWRLRYRDLKLRPEHAERVKELRDRQPYAAMHVRRTDHVQLAKEMGGYIEDDEYVAWADGFTMPVFLATDNARTQASFINRARVFTAGPITLDSWEGGQRNTTLARSAIDLVTCVHAKDFKGCRESSFTNLVQTMRDLECAGY